MKVYIRDKRSNPRIIYIDGKKFYLGSKKEYLKDISPNALHALSQKEYLEIRPFEEEKQEVCGKNEDIKEAPVSKEEPLDILDLKKEEIKDEHGCIEEVEVKESVIEEMYYTGDSKEDKEVKEIVEDKPDYSSMTKKVLKGIVEDKGGDPTGMSKSNMVDWLNAHA